MNIDIIQIGTGGTGGCFYTKMVRFLADTLFENMVIHYTIMDGDHVEYKNLGRQPFTEDDLGKNKAVALAMAAEEALNVKVKAYPHYLRPDNIYMIDRLNKTSYSSNDLRIIIGAVDNHACRKLLHEYFMRYSNLETLIYIDSANEISSGEIVIGRRTVSKISAPDRVHYYPEILQDTEKPVYEKSCEELNQSAPQHLATNSIAADLMFSYVSQVIMAGELAHKAPAGIIYFDAFKLFSRFYNYEEKIHGKIKQD